MIRLCRRLLRFMEPRIHRLDTMSVHLTLPPRSTARVPVLLWAGAAADMGVDGQEISTRVLLAALLTGNRR